MRSLPALLAAATFASPVTADPRIATRGYDAASVALVTGQLGIQSTIEFASDERIENVAVGNSASWQVTPNKHANLLFVKPVTAGTKTNMTVITDKRTYLFDLILRKNVPPIYVLRFTYPKLPNPPPPIPIGPAIPAPAAAQAPTPDELNFAWKSDGAKSLLPSRIFDDGRSTWLQWSKDAPLPAILSQGPGGDEGPMNYSVHGDYVVLDSVPEQIILRQGKAVARLTPLHSPDRVYGAEGGNAARGATFVGVSTAAVADARR